MIIVEEERAQLVFSLDEQTQESHRASPPRMENPCPVELEIRISPFFPHDKKNFPIDPLMSQRLLVSLDGRSRSVCKPHSDDCRPKEA